MSQKDRAHFPFVVEPDICVATITSGYLEAWIAYALLIKALLCGGKRDLNLTICQLLNYGIFTALQRFSVMICRLCFITAAAVNSDTIHFHWAGVPRNLFATPPFPSVSGLHGRSPWLPSIPFHYLPCLCFSLLIYTLNMPSALW